MSPSHRSSSTIAVPVVDDGSWTGFEKLLLWGGLGGAIFVVVPVLLYFLVWREQWANEHRQALLELNAQAESLVRQQEYEKASERYAEVFATVSERDLADAAFTQKIESARLASAENNEKVKAILGAREAMEQQQRREAQNEAIEAARRPKERY